MTSSGLRKENHYLNCCLVHMALLFVETKFVCVAPALISPKMHSGYIIQVPNFQITTLLGSSIYPKV
jgi:hypothetical protein